MMQFLRKHQKKLFLVIAGVTLISFAFFGTSSAFGAREIEDKKIGKTIDGSTIYEKDLRALTQLLSQGSSDILRTDLIDTGVFSLLAEKYFGELQGDFSEKLEKAKTAVFYSHPQAPFINAIQVWNRFSPMLAHDLKEVQAGSVNAKTFSTYAKLYLDQQAFPPELLRTILLYEQKNYSWIAPDYQLGDTRALALFGYHTFEEWFGARFSDILGKFILNTAAIAEKKGYKVSQKEARTDLMMMCYQTVRMKALGKEVTAQEATEYMKYLLLASGIDESRAVHLWKKVMLVHRFFQDLQQGVLLDPIPYEQFSTFADAKAHVEVYQLPETLRLKDFRSMLKVQYYLEAVSPGGKQSVIELPKQFYSVDEVEKRHPQLVTSKYELEIAKVSSEDAASRLSLRQMWEFEMSDEGWALLIAQFPVLNKQSTETIEGREAVLDTLSADVRKKIDRFARQSMLKRHPEWIKEALASQETKKTTALIRSKGAFAPFEDIEETVHLRQALEKAEIGETITFTTPGEETFYQITILQKPDKKEVMTLQEALEHDWLGALLDEKLEEALENARKKETAIYKGSDGSWKPFNEVKDHVGAYVYSDLLKTLSKEPLTYDEYAAKRFEGVMQHAKTSIQAEMETSSFLNPTGYSLIDQWMLSKRRQEIKRSDTTELPKGEMFTQAIGSWSSIATPRGGNACFFHLLERDASHLKVQDQVSEGQKLIGRDVMRQKIQTLLDDVGAL
ncbi:MAG: hypothetical protein KBA81_05845 [Rhabdochlamydiaceae bacterium]|nr:hypothetical protein [Rhabdochlamydiaceae bacterium]